MLLTVTGLMLGIVLTSGRRAWADSEAATLKSVTLSASPTGAELVLRVDGMYSYKTVQASPDTLFIDLAGAKPKGVARTQHWVSPLFSGYKLLLYQDAAGHPVVRVQVDTKQAIPFMVQKDASSLRLLFGKSLPASAPNASAPVPAPAETSVRVAPPTSSKGPLLVSKVSFDKHESGETFVDVSTSRTVSYRVTTLLSPPRLVVDIEGAQNASPQRNYPAGTGVLKAVRIGQFREKDPAIVRVVADLNGNPVFDVHATPAGVRIELRPRGLAKPASLNAKALVSPVKPEKTQTVETAAATPAPVPVRIAIAEAPAPTAEVIEAKHVVEPPPPAVTREAVKTDVQTTLPAIASSKQAVAAPLPPPSSATPEALRAELAAQTLTPGTIESPRAAQDAPPAAPSGPAEEPKSAYTGEPISLNLKDVDLKDFFRLIHEISGLNIILDPNVAGSVTLVLDSVPWDQALEIVMKNNRLGKVLEGNVLRIAKVETLTAEQEGQTKLASARMDAAPLVTIFRPISYAKAQDIAAILKSWAGGGALSRRGTVLVDVRGNTLIVSDVQSQMPIIDSIVTKLDRKAKQVSIEARVVLANADFTRTLSTALSGSTHTLGGSTQAGGTTGAGATVATTTTFPVLQTLSPVPSSEFGSIAITNASSRYLINAIISAQEERDQAKTLSRPTIVTQNNVEGMVQQGVQVPIQTTINNTISVQYYNATLQLTVTPQVTEDNNIFLIIHVLNDSVGASIASVGPEINTQEATTRVLVPDGGTVVFGGITVTSRSKSATYVPWIGSIPILGHLFKTSNVQDTDQELLFFVSPKILTI
jgi:type IV pilus assembly protein PilQ